MFTKWSKSWIGFFISKERMAYAGLLIELARFGEADAAIARLPAPAAAAPVPWKRIRAVGRQESDGVRLHLHLQADPDA